MIPDIVVAGVSKGGSTTIGDYLEMHPDTYFVNNEPHFFDLNYNRGIDWYKHLFRNGKITDVVGERTPSYFYHRGVPERMTGLIPDATIIMTLRNPVKRAYSHYWHTVRFGWEKRPFSEVVRDEIIKNRDTDKLRYVRLGLLQRNCDPLDIPYLAIGKYAEHLHRWELSFNHEQIVPLVIEKLGDTSISSLCKRLCIRNKPLIKNKSNIGGAPRSFQLAKLTRYINFHPSIQKRILNSFNMKNYPPMDEATHSVMHDYYQSTYEDLQEYIGFNPSELWQ